MGVVAWQSLSYCGGPDAFKHYQIIRYSWDHPYLFLDLWGKPILTLLASPFARFGIVGVSVFNILAALAAAWLAVDLARRLGCRYPILTAVLILFSPEYFTSSIAPMTETLFSLFLVGSIYLFFVEQYVFSAIAISFLPLVRTEGYILLVLFAGAYLWRRRLLPVPLLAAGSLIYSLIGWRVFGDFLWMIHYSPYSLQSNHEYGHGSLFSFVWALPRIAGWPMSILLVAGVVCGLIQIFSHLRSRADARTVALVLVMGCAALYFSAHAYVWWHGIGASAGVTRVMAGIVPLMGIIAMLGFPALDRWRANRQRYSSVVVVLVMAWAVYQPFQHFELPPAIPQENRLQISASAWLKRSGYAQAKIFYYDPYLFYLLGKDPYNSSLGQMIWYIHTPPADHMRAGDILVWDSFLGITEGHVRPSQLDADPRLVKLAAFRPLRPPLAEPDPTEEIRVFIRVDKN